VLLLVLGLGLLVALALAVYVLLSSSGRRRQRRALAGARWQTAHRSDEGRTLVVVRRMLAGSSAPDGVLQERVIGEVADTDPDWEVHFAELTGRARNRAAALNAYTPARKEAGRRPSSADEEERWRSSRQLKPSLAFWSASCLVSRIHYSRGRRSRPQSPAHRHVTCRQRPCAWSADRVEGAVPEPVRCGRVEGPLLHPVRVVGQGSLVRHCVGLTAVIEVAPPTCTNSGATADTRVVAAPWLTVL